MFRYVFVIWNIALIIEVARLAVSAEDNIDSDAVGVKGGDCLPNSLDNTLYCRGSRAIRNIIKNLNRSDKPLVLMRGLEIVSTTSKDNQTEKEFQQSHPTNDDDSFLSLVSSFLRTHELNLKFSDLLGDESDSFLPQAIRQSIDKTDSHGGPKEDIEEARKKDKGQSIVLAVALMFGKMLAMLGLGGIAALAMKALGVAMAALMMAGLVGLKSLAQHGNENSHSISYLTSEGHHHHRRRRRRSATKPEVYDPLTLVYGSWQNNPK